MFKFGKSKADIQLYNSENMAARVQNEIEEARDAKNAQMKRLRAQRLAKEAADKKS